MSRVQLALNVADLDEAVKFYSKFFDTEPAKRQPGYANFAIVDPPLKLVLFEGAGVPGSLNHLGVEVETPGAVQSSERRMANVGLSTRTEMEAECCFALQDKVWVDGPDETSWEVYAVLADIEPTQGSDANMCCTGEISEVPIELGAISSMNK